MLWGGAFIWYSFCGLFGGDISIFKSHPPLARHPKDLLDSKIVKEHHHPWRSSDIIDTTWPHPFFNPQIIACSSATPLLAADRLGVWQHDQSRWMRVSSLEARSLSTICQGGSCSSVIHSHLGIQNAHSNFTIRFDSSNHHSNSVTPIPLPDTNKIGFAAEHRGRIILYDDSYKPLAAFRRPRKSNLDYSSAILTYTDNHLIIFLPKEGRVHIWNLQTGRLKNDLSLISGNRMHRINPPKTQKNQVIWKGLCARDNEILILAERPLRNAPSKHQLHKFPWPIPTSDPVIIYK